MTVKPIPDGYRTVTPYLVIERAPELIGFMKDAFDAEETVRMDREDGLIAHAEVEIGDSKIMVADANAEFPPMPSLIHLYVEDCDKTFRRAVEAGATALNEPETQFYGDRSGGVRDASGNTWWITTHVEDVSAEEISKRAKQQES
ncbi:MAG TPA: VOC family protein [Actinomycetota bacterium]|nr:VOC family protein [Actinomycetota bacterium]